MRGSMALDVIPNSKEVPVVSQRSTVQRTPRMNLSSTFLSGGGEEKELDSRKEELLAIISEIVV